MEANLWLERLLPGGIEPWVTRLAGQPLTCRATGSAPPPLPPPPTPIKEQPCIFLDKSYFLPTISYHKKLLVDWQTVQTLIRVLLESTLDL